MREQSSGTAADELPATNLARDLLVYTLARLGILVVSAGVLVLLNVPLLVAAAVAVVLVMPLSMLVFSPLRRRVATGIAQRTAQRREKREQLRAQLRGEDGGAAEDVTGENTAAAASSEKHVTGADADGAESGSGKDSTNEDESGEPAAEEAEEAAGGSSGESASQESVARGRSE